MIELAQEFRLTEAEKRLLIKQQTKEAISTLENILISFDEKKIETWLSLTETYLNRIRKTQTLLTY